MNIEIKSELVVLTEIEGSNFINYGFKIDNNRPELHFVSEFIKNGKSGITYKEKELWHSQTRAESPIIPKKIKEQINYMFVGKVVNVL